MIKTFDKLPLYIQQKFQEVWFDPSKSESAKVEVKGKLAKIFLLIDGDRSFCVLEQNTSKQLLLNLFKTEKEPWKIWSTTSVIKKEDFEKFVQSLDLNDLNSDLDILFMDSYDNERWSWWRIIYEKKNPEILINWNIFSIEVPTRSGWSKKFENFNSIRIRKNGVTNFYKLATQEPINQK